MKNITERDIRQDGKPINTYIADGVVGIGSGEGSNKLFQRIQSGRVFGNFMNRVRNKALGDGLESTTNKSSGPYFLNESVIGSSQSASDALIVLRSMGASRLPQFSNLESKLKQGPGVGFVIPPDCYYRLLDSGQRNPEYALNYNAPGGTELARQGISNIIGASIDPEKPSPISSDGCFQVSGATEGLQVAIQAVKEINGGDSRVALLGPGYYAAPLAADRLGLTPYRIASQCMMPSRGFLPSSEEITRQITDNTKLVIVSAPNNPDGSDYSETDWANILQTLKDQPDRRLLLDNIFRGLSFDKAAEDPCLTTAQKLGVLDKIIVTGSLSKSLNLPGPRIGWLATGDPKMQEVINEILVDRRCNPPLTQSPLLEFEGLACRVEALMQDDKKIQNPRDAVANLGINPATFDIDNFSQMYEERRSWKQATLDYYKGNLAIAETILRKSGVMIDGSPNKAGFNTFVRLKVPFGTNSMDYLSQLMITTATYTQMSPCFGLPQKEWDDVKGLWLRISYACDRNDLIEGIQRLVLFNRFYTEGPSSPNRLQVSYDQQI